MPATDLFDHPLPPAPWHITTEQRGFEGTHIHTLRHGTTAIEHRTGPHGLSLLTGICTHLNATGANPASKPTKPAATQPDLL